MDISDVNNDGIAMDGMDTVAYYEGVPMKGNKMFIFTIGDLTYYFSSKENLEKFEKEPAKYLPIAGAYSTGTTVAPPEMQVVDGRVVGEKTLAYRRGLEDSVDSIENEVPMDIKEDGNIEMQNLSDAEK